MAKYKRKKTESVLLGFEDDRISEKHQSHVGYWTNKVGGTPDYPVEGVPPSKCELCALPQLLVVQIYAPFEDSPFHRTLYVFCCINPNCWNLSQSWTCRRSQVLDKGNECSQDATKLDWCAGADDWDDDNGNAMPVQQTMATDSDDSSSLSIALGVLRVDQCNANWEAEKSSGAVGKTKASAEIEGDEGEVVCIDTPTAPQHDLIALLEATAPLPSLHTAVAFEPSFLWVAEEEDNSSASDHVHSLLMDYQSRYGEVCQTVPAASKRPIGEDQEKYERSMPAHGDALFHDFVMKLQENPGQILRYSRGSEPLLISPIEVPRVCRNCQGPVVFELQLLPTLLHKLKLPGDSEVHIDFGNVVIYTCKKSCWSSEDTFKDEVVCVQVEEATARRE